LCWFSLFIAITGIFTPAYFGLQEHRERWRGNQMG
jgi:hypothetical protein